jgi:hypothetical protein
MPHLDRNYILVDSQCAFGPKLMDIQGARAIPHPTLRTRKCRLSRHISSGVTSSSIHSRPEDTPPTFRITRGSPAEASTSQMPHGVAPMMSTPLSSTASRQNATQSRLILPKDTDRLPIAWRLAVDEEPGHELASHSELASRPVPERRRSCIRRPGQFPPVASPVLCNYPRNCDSSAVPLSRGLPFIDSSSVQLSWGLPIVYCTIIPRIAIPVLCNCPGIAIPVLCNCPRDCH